jgi:hypothetical protein
VNQPLPNPRFRVIDRDGVEIAANDDWGSNADPAALTAAFAQTGAFSFPAGSPDAATIVRLWPGQYTVLVESADGTPGVALVEAYELGP